MVSSTAFRKIIFILIDSALLLCGLAIILVCPYVQPVKQLDFLEFDVENIFLIYKILILIGYSTILIAIYGVNVFWFVPQFYLTFTSVLVTFLHLEMVFMLFFMSKNHISTLKVLVEVMAITGAISFRENVLSLDHSDLPAFNYSYPPDFYSKAFISKQKLIDFHSYFFCCASSEQPTWSLILPSEYCCGKNETPPCDMKHARLMELCDKALLLYIWKQYRYYSWIFTVSLLVKCMIAGSIGVLYYKEIRDEYLFDANRVT